METGEHTKTYIVNHGDDIDNDFLDETKQEYSLDELHQYHGDLDDVPHAEHTLWIPSPPTTKPAATGRLPFPVMIPTDQPGIRSAFSRAWAPILATRDVKQDDFLHFIDHLNVCQAASPPLQVLSLAGSVLGFTPIPFAFAVAMGVQAVAIGGIVTVARVRIHKYLEAVNKEYFHPRGLQARLAKQQIIPEITHQQIDSPLLAPPAYVQSTGYGPPRNPTDLRDRRIGALKDFIAPLELHDLPPSKVEHNLLDRLSATMAARQQQKAERKAIKKQVKAEEKGRAAEYASGEEQRANKFLWVVIQDLETTETSGTA